MAAAESRGPQVMTAVDNPGFREQSVHELHAGRFFVWGGRSYEDGAVKSDGKFYDVAADAWVDMASTDTQRPSARRQMRSAWTGTELLIWGGVDANGDNVGDGALYDPSTNAWRAISHVNEPTARSYDVNGWTGSRFVVWGGADAGGATATGAIFDPATNTWTAMSMDLHNAAGTIIGPLPLRPDYGSAALGGGRIVVFGGDDAGSPVNTGFTFDPQKNIWTATDTTGAPSPRSMALLGAFESGIFAFGGKGGAKPSHPTDGARLDLATGVWERLPSMLAPQSTDYEGSSGSLLRVGAHLVTFGGYSEDTDHWTLQAFDVSKKLWSQAPATGSPFTGAFPLAEIAGNRLAVFVRGDDATTTLRVTFYDPAANTWHPGETVALRADRTDPALSYDAGQLVLWGGQATCGAADCALSDGLVIFLP